MNKPVSEPVIPPQPDKEVYGPNDLALFKEYTRESYRAAFALDALPWDPSRLTKFWFDSTVFDSSSRPGGAIAYKIFDQDKTGAWGFQDMTLTLADAASVNLPGAIAYPQYAVQPTAATRGTSGMTANYFSLESEARALVPTFAGTGLVDQGITPVFPVVYPPNEPRRMWAIMLPNGDQLNVGLLMLERNASGIGSPGHWVTSPNGGPVWSADPPAPTGLDDTGLHRAMPVRTLLPNERIGMGTLGFGAVIVRTDLGQAQAEQDGKFTPGDRQKLQEIYRIVGKLGI